MSAAPPVDQSNDTPFRARGAMQTAHPDYRHYTAREYGTQVGYYQLLDAFAKAGVTASIATNGGQYKRSAVARMLGRRRIDVPEQHGPWMLPRPV